MKPERIIARAIVGGFVLLAIVCFCFAGARTAEGRFTVAGALFLLGVVTLWMAKAAAVDFRRLLERRSVQL